MAWEALRSGDGPNTTCRKVGCARAWMGCPSPVRRACVPSEVSRLGNSVSVRYTEASTECGETPNAGGFPVATHSTLTIFTGMDSFPASSSTVAHTAGVSKFWSWTRGHAAFLEGGGNTGVAASPGSTGNMVPRRMLFWLSAQMRTAAVFEVPALKVPTGRLGEPDSGSAGANAK